MVSLASAISTSSATSEPPNLVDRSRSSSLNDFNTLFTSVLTATQAQTDLMGGNVSSHPISFNTAHSTTQAQISSELHDAASANASKNQATQSAVEQAHHAKHAQEIKKAEGKKAGHASHKASQMDSGNVNPTNDPTQAASIQSLNGQTVARDSSDTSITNATSGASTGSSNTDQSLKIANEPGQTGASDANPTSLISDEIDSSFAFNTDATSKKTEAEFQPVETDSFRMTGDAGLGMGRESELSPAISSVSANVLNGLSGNTLPVESLSSARQNLISLGKEVSLSATDNAQVYADGLHNDTSSAVNQNRGTANAANSTTLNIPIPIGEGPWAAALGQQALFMAKNELGTAQLTLNPEHLGPIQVTLDLQHDQASAVFVSPHDAVRQAIEASLPHLRDMFSQAGLQLGQTQVQSDLNGQFAQSFRQNGNNGAQRNALGATSQAKEIAPNGVDAVSVPLTSRISRGLLDTFA